MQYRFEITGQVGNWAQEWFEGMTIHQQNDKTIVVGTVVDQPHLHGILNRFRDLNLELLSVKKLDEATRGEK